MLRKIIIVSSIVIVIFAIWYAMQFGTLQSVPFNTAMKMSEQSSDTEQAQKVKIDADVMISDDFPLENNAGHFFARDKQGTIFKVEYTGKDPLPSLINGIQISVFGHVHGGDPAYVHASQVVLR